MIHEPVIVLIGGLGTRLRALYPDRPKALAPVSGRPFIAWMMEWLRKQGVERVHLAAGFRAEQVIEWAKGYQLPGLAITVSIEPMPLGTAGGIRHALEQFPHTGPVLVLNGDSLLPNAMLNDVIYAGRRHGQWRTVIAAVEMTERGQYGTVDLDDHDRVLAFREKADNERGWVNGGIYYLHPEVLDAIRPGDVASIEKDFFPALARDGKLGSVRVQGPLLDMGTPQGLQTMERFVR